MANMWKSNETNRTKVISYQVVEIQKKSRKEQKAPKLQGNLCYTHTTMSGVSVTKRWAKEKYVLTKTMLDVTPTQRETVAWLQYERQPICALALFRSLLSHTLAYKLESLSLMGDTLFVCFLFSLFFLIVFLPFVHYLSLKQLLILPQHTHSHNGQVHNASATLYELLSIG